MTDRTQHWQWSYRADPRALPLADRHYNRQKIGSPQFVPPGRCAVFLTDNADALWVTSWPMAEYVRHAWAGAWVNSLFRREGGGTRVETDRGRVRRDACALARPAADGHGDIHRPGEDAPQAGSGQVLQASWLQAGWLYRRRPRCPSTASGGLPGTVAGSAGVHEPAQPARPHWGGGVW